MLRHALLFALLPCTAPAAVDYTQQIKPLLQAACVKCHGASNQKGKARVDTAAATIKGGEHGAAIIPGNSAGSLLVQAIEGRHDEVSKMPYKRPPLDSAQVALIRQWIDEGAKAPVNEKPSDDRHWAFIAPVASQDKEAGIDFFIRQRLAKEGLKPSPEAAPETLLRRVSLDLTGLPPTPEEVTQFASEMKGAKEPQARNAVYERWVDKLLSSPHYGERWGRWWLDQARYADSNGYSVDAPRIIWPYRDWVIKALNENMPFDQFTIEQLAGDLLPNATMDQKVATGFHRNTQINGEGGIDPEQFRVESVVDRTNTTSTVWLGLTIGCCQCHDHKFDPIPQREYYAMFAFFNSTEADGHAGQKTSTVTLPPVKDEGGIQMEINALRFEFDRFFRDNPKQVAEVQAAQAALTKEQRKALSKTLKKALAVPFEKRSIDEQRLVFASLVKDNKAFNKLNTTMKEREAGLSPPVTTLVMQELAKPRDTHLFIKGDFTRPDALVQRGVLSALPPMEGVENPSRLDLAKWIMSAKNPLTARVIMNRVWQQYFGRGIVETENDFGTMGAAPTHPELLDWLATQFIAQKWDLKAMQRAVVLSQTYRQSSALRADLKEKDANNYLLARQRRLRVDAEIVRDISLSASGLLATKLGGPPVYPPIPEGVMSLGQIKHAWPVSKGEDRYRRALYTFVFRATPPPELSVFDAPEGLGTCTRRLRSNTPLQALTLLNDASFHEFAEALGTRLIKDVPQGDAARIDRGFLLCTSRLPSSEERESLLKLIAGERAAGSDEPAVWHQVARVLLNLDETLTRE